MVRVQFQTVLPVPLSQMWSFVGEPANLCQWDPGIVSSKKATPGATGVGTEYDVENQFMGNKSQLRES